ncbi:hypothetical protein F5Y16DRAFT_369489 [Xylariaceae sp. FL0255]|nr:hypothetical protein F5Y16DRAFT_369489 [Xylariaceae sp. FL0255]
MNRPTTLSTEAKMALQKPLGLLRRLRHCKWIGRRLRLLDLPRPILLHILEFLDQRSMRCFLSTSEQARSIVKHLHRLHGSFKQEELTYIQLEYLMALSRHHDDYWVCEACVCLHRMEKADLPINPNFMSCPLSTMERAVLVPHLRSITCPFRNRTTPFRFDHRHVQLALKYNRICDTHQRAYLRHICTPMNREEDIRSPTGGRVRVRYEAVPKIRSADWNPISGAHERERKHFLLKSRWEFRSIDHNDQEASQEVGLISDAQEVLLFSKGVTLEAMGCLDICPHLKLCQPSCPIHNCGDTGEGEARNPLTKVMDKVLDRIAFDHEASRFQGHRRPTKPSKVMKDGECTECLTWFSIKASGTTRCPNPTLLEIEVYRDLGDEKLSPWASTWKKGPIRAGGPFNRLKASRLNRWEIGLVYETGHSRRYLRCGASDL